MSSSSRHVFRLAVLVGFMTGCGTSTAPASDEAAVVELASRVVIRGADSVATVQYAVTNRGAGAVRLTSICGERIALAIERQGPGGWESHSSLPCLAVNDMSAKSLLPGTSRQTRVTIRETGTFRILIGTDQGVLYSDAFEVR